MRSKPIKGAEDYILYEDGRVWSNKRNKFLKMASDNGYGVYGLCIKGKSKTFKIHRLLALHFIPNPDNHPYVRHLNDVPSDNRLENLVWGTPSQNSYDKYNNGYVSKRRLLCENDVLSIFKDERLHKDIAQEFGVSRHIVSVIKRKKSYVEITKDLGEPGKPNRRKITDIQVLEIFKSKMPANELSKKYGIAVSSVYFIKSGKLHYNITKKLIQKGGE